MIPIASTLQAILIAYVHIRGGTDGETLFTNIFGEPLMRTTLQYCVIKHCKSVVLKSIVYICLGIHL